MARASEMQDGLDVSFGVAPMIRTIISMVAMRTGLILVSCVRWTNEDTPSIVSLATGPRRGAAG